MDEHHERMEHHSSRGEEAGRRAGSKKKQKSGADMQGRSEGQKSTAGQNRAESRRDVNTGNSCQKCLDNISSFERASRSHAKTGSAAMLKT